MHGAVRIGNTCVQRFSGRQVPHPLVRDLIREGQHSASAQFQHAGRRRFGRRRYAFSAPTRRKGGHLIPELVEGVEVDPTSIAGVIAAPGR